MRKEGLATQNRGTRTDADMILTKDIGGSIKEDALFFAGKLLIDTDPFHCSTSAGKDCFVISEDHQLLSRNLEQC